MMLFYGVYLISLPFKYNRPDRLRVAIVETTLIRSSQQLFRLWGLWTVLMNIERKIAHIDAARMSATARKRAKQTNQSHHIRKDKSFHFEMFKRGGERCEVAAQHQCHEIQTDCVENRVDSRSVRCRASRFGFVWNVFLFTFFSRIFRLPDTIISFV